MTARTQIHDGVDTVVATSPEDKTVYSKGIVAVAEISDRAPAGLRLKVEKAVYCPVSLGPDSQCRRAVDDVSCYCFTSTDVCAYRAMLP